MCSSENPAEKASPFTICEAALAATSGIPRKMLLVLRQTNLVAGQDWIKEHKEIKLTAAAAQKLGDAYARLLPGSLKSVMGIPDAAIPKKDAPLDAGAQVAPLKAELTELTVRGALPSGKMLSARLPDGGIVLVRVRTTVNFMQAATIFARRIEDGLYEFTGPYPRWRGEKLYRS